MKIVCVGAPGSGKSVLTSQIYSALKASGRRTEIVPEMIRYQINRYGPMTSIWEQYRTRQQQMEMEDAVPDAVDYVICDSGTLSPYFYSLLYCDITDPRQRLVLHDMYRHFIDDLFLDRYDIILYVPCSETPDLQDGTRYQTEREIRILDQHMEMMFTKALNIPGVHRINAGYDKRLESAMWKILKVAEPEMPSEQYVKTVIEMSGNID